MIRDNQTIETLVSNLPLVGPPESLDQKMAQMFDSSDLVEDDQRVETDAARLPSTWRLWPAFVSTALVASLAGFLLGQAIDIGRFDRSGTQRELASLNSRELGEGRILTPVSFNFSAFELLHKHSQDVDTGSCKQCHIGPNDETAKWFEGWFYGNKKFFDVHAGGDIGNCSSCHKIAEPKAEEPGLEKREREKPAAEKRNGHPHPTFGNCLECHLVGHKPSKPVQRKDG